ncbi:hypothetical protein [Kribbella jiaozuonensis]|uniref:Haloacetate dehalogenase n=1 Tax=Kribbella jiaozuonensis TaxID=2575441 RepID=A0A4U3LKR7_9ACTN|nr:hypothetical protein [Kribbella jiaozuonensis]TKK76180.1 hypothetical protein FDA38_27595 [Kribbella jiaozuonensis]
MAIGPDSGSIATTTRPIARPVGGSSARRWPWCRQVEGHGIKSGHHMAEQAPEELANSLSAFLRG